ncbi:cation diffusion facilitator family transporter [Halothermothrix orenii]|uniref:Cation diffusion facilitator family transporter n=1 Tax=Halothermothrix orenii (strain H 168 / OCM 544 / DSM 9562) TaxID=373903 RepID=B8D1T7_HALOH|nr:cation diffusion facilitator family transporter [Halothermothrix orenii]ACL69164.1 cation diffusion facilitator family transporter [Halothermothrix orenii H 168]
MMEEERYRETRKVSFISIVINIILSVAKIFIGISFASKALLADGVHSVSDIASTVVVLISIKFSQNPADERHPYGHGKAEQIGTALLGLMLLITGLTLIKDTAGNMITGEITVPGQITLWIALISIISKEALYQYTVKIGKKINSKGLVADAHHHRSDALSSVAALAGIAGARLGYPFLDPLAGLIVALLIIKISIEIIKEAVHELMDGIPDEDKIVKIRKIAENVSGVKDIGDIKIRSYGPHLIVDLTVAVDKNLKVIEGHQVAANIKNELLNSDSNVEDVLVHVDPWQEG